MSHYPLDRKRAACDVYRYLTDPLCEHHMKSDDAVKLASVASGGASQSQIFLWLKEDLSIKAVAQKPENRGASRLLSDDQEVLLVGFAFSSRSSLEPVTLSTLLQFCQSHFSVEPSLPTLSRTMNEYGFSSQKAMSRSSRMVTDQVVDDAISSLEEIRSYGFEPHRILIMDETGVWSNVRQPRTYHYANW